MVGYSIPTEKQVCLALLNAIATHRWVRNAQIYAPSLNPAIPPELVRIQKLRTFGSMELIEGGLTLSVYPYYARTDAQKGSIPGHRVEQSLTFPQQGLGLTMGNAQSPDRTIRSVVTVVVQLHYRDASIGLPQTLTSDTVRVMPSTQVLPQGFNVSLQDPDLPTELNDRTKNQVFEQTIEYESLPGEDILREWTPLLRHVIRDVNVLYPYNIRNPNILSSNYPTSNWLNDSVNLVFHNAYSIVQYDMFEPATPPDYMFPGVKSIVADTETPIESLGRTDLDPVQPAYSRPNLVTLTTIKNDRRPSTITFYVSKTGGSDMNSGALNSPFATEARAQREVDYYKVRHPELPLPTFNIVNID